MDVLLFKARPVKVRFFLDFFILFYLPNTFAIKSISIGANDVANDANGKKPPFCFLLNFLFFPLPNMSRADFWHLYMVVLYLNHNIFFMLAKKCKPIDSILFFKLTFLK